ncbi:MAG: glutamine-hydrolyzing carbamoyl-phosphate synthase small subunit [Deltaproteobacteria bacterium]|nr:glutamine-hydrolyzing carbamoyl-phosphate synthase small subunit [Deltaproteobacteria bacterium]
MRSKRALLVLADGTVFEGYSLGAEGESVGEVVFNTSMTGYQEILTDPSYRGQIVTMTYSQIGNYGINDEDRESRRPWLSGFVVKEACDYPSNWRMGETLDAYLKRHNIVGIHGIDTRALTRHIRECGAVEGIISSEDRDFSRLVRCAKESPGLVGRDLVKEVTTQAPYEWSEGAWSLEGGYSEAGEGRRKRVVVYDFGVKFNILRNLVQSGFDVTVVPAATPSDDVLELNPDGLLLSNGPGDPSAVTYGKENISKLVGKKPILAICLGHQILAMALGGTTYKLKFGHHGGNQPVMDLTTGKVEITSQNHGFAVNADSLKGVAELTHLNLNDRTAEGMRHKKYPLLSIQYHPEASPGPHDAAYLFSRFARMIEEG